MALALLALAALSACGGGDDPGPEATAQAVFAAIESGDFACPGPLFPDNATLYRYYTIEQLQGGLCSYALQDAAALGALKNSGARAGSFEIAHEGTLYAMQGGTPLRYVEGTVHAANQSLSLHINRLVEVEGRWYLFVLSSHPVLSH